MEEIIKLLNKCIEEKMDFKITSEEATTLLEYIESQNKQIGIANTLNQMKQNNISTMCDNLEKAERKIKELQDQLNKTKMKQLKDEEFALDLQLKNKKYQIEQYVKTIGKLEHEINELNDKLNIIY